MSNAQRLKLIDELMTKEQNKSDEVYSNYMGGGSKSCMKTYQKHEDILDILEIARQAVLDMLRREQLENKDDRLKEIKKPSKEVSEEEHRECMKLAERYFGSDENK